uniref:Cytochrome c oxidase subunit 2 n=1 Tax=Libiocoris heissi TaxID=1176477 RepID=A0A172DYV6_9HEMI|nr:cytochrome c oxidase subunit II [Libiocoris heissi]AFI54710.1 cytochrome c oxidase subunit II [Libiocoris heissi]
MSTWNNMHLQDPNSSTMEQLINFHDQTMNTLIMITITITYITVQTSINKLINRSLLEGQTIELIWTMMPSLMLTLIAIPSLHTLYMMDEMSSPSMTIKTTGHQWYWSYEYSDFKDIEFDSYMTPWEMTKSRLLEVDNRVILPTSTPTRILVSAADVIHSWTIPSLGVKVDATPGRLNQLQITMNRPGILFGQCSEICGSNHSFMPIMIESVPVNNFLQWLNNN